MDKEELLWDFEQTRKKLQKTRWGLRWLIRTRQIPIVRIGRGRIYFDPREIEAWINRNKIPEVRGDKRS